MENTKLRSSEFIISTKDNIELIGTKYIPENFNAVIIIVHGMAEHSARYENFAKFLNKNKYAVYTYDQRGHGKTINSLENIGFLAEKNGWQKITADLDLVIKQVKKEQSDKKIFLLGHSMGSFIVRTYVTDYKENISGIILSGTTGSGGFMSKIGMIIINTIILFNSKKSPSPFMTKMSFGSFNKEFKPNKTDFDWLSRDNKKVAEYVADPYCGGVFPIGFFKDLIFGIEYINKQKYINKINVNLPVLLISGDNDLVSKKGKLVLKVSKNLQKAGIKNIKCKLYKGARHEVLNEINRAEIYKDIVNWTDKLV